MAHRRFPGGPAYLAGIVVALLLVASAATAQLQRPHAPTDGHTPPSSETGQPSDSAAAVATVARFHALVRAADTSGVLALLADDLVVLESGDYEDRAAYRAHHLGADMAYAGATRTERRIRAVSVQGDLAWVSSTSATRGEFRGRAISSVGAELMVLRREAGTWRIAAIHWSSRARRS